MLTVRVELEEYRGRKHRGVKESWKETIYSSKQDTYHGKVMKTREGACSYFKGNGTSRKQHHVQL